MLITRNIIFSCAQILWTSLYMISLPLKILHKTMKLKLGMYIFTLLVQGGK